MTPKEKAEHLIKKFSYYTVQENWQTKNYFAMDCALIAVDEIIKALEEHHWQNRHVIEDYKQVKQEIELL